MPPRRSSQPTSSTRALQSAFVPLPKNYLHTTKQLASVLPLPRPLNGNAAILSPPSHTADSLSCPRRPKWRFDMSKKELDNNEHAIFNKWLDHIDSLLSQSHSPPLATTQSESTNPIQHPPSTMPPSPTYFERNIEVWRQLWRVTELSQILLVLLDSRCPLLHYPHSLSAYLSDRKVILVLTKVDISGPARTAAWTAYFRHHYPGLRIVHVESYVQKKAKADHQGRIRYEPRLPQPFRETLIEAVREVHAEMLQPPENVKCNQARLKGWKPPVKRIIDWEALLNPTGTKLGSAAPTLRRKNESDRPEDQEPEFLTIGLIGQPNVGKSSLLNALFGKHKVRASKTPGKTKHFQTLFWSPDVRLVDCPGLVMPSFVPMEMQVLSGILPISGVSAIPSCIYHASQFLPLERVYNLTHPILAAPPVEDRRTWRGGKKPEGGKEKAVVWTAMDVLTAYANAKGWVTAKVGRPDVHRAGNALLRALAEGKVAWAFWPPGTDPATLDVEGSEPEMGIWIPKGKVLDEDSGEESNQEEEVEEEKDEVTEDDDEEDSVEEVRMGGVGRFGVLLEDDEEDE